MEKEPRFKANDIIRYSDGISAIFRYDGTFNNGRYYGTHVLGGSHSACDQIFFDLRLANDEDLKFCKRHRPEWFIDRAKAKREIVAETIFNTLCPGIRYLENDKQGYEEAAQAAIEAIERFNNG